MLDQRNGQIVIYGNLSLTSSGLFHAVRYFSYVYEGFYKSIKGSYRFQSGQFLEREIYSEEYWHKLLLVSLDKQEMC